MPAEQASYTRRLLTRWSRRDRLTVLVVGVTTAFLVGSTLLLAAAGAQTAVIAGEFNTSTTVTYEDSYTAAQTAADNDELVLPTTVLTHQNGSTRRFVGIPPDTPDELANASVDWQRVAIPSPNQSVQGPVAIETRQRFQTADGTVVYEVQPHEAGESLFPSDWYVANASIVRSAGDQVGAFIIDPGQNATGLLSIPQTGTPVVTALIFLFAGMREMLTVLLAATVGSALLILVVVYNVLRMTVRDRQQAIKVIRSTGGTPRRVLGLFGLRAGLIVILGVALGYAIGVVVTNAVVNVAVYAGLPISLTPTLTPLTVGVLSVMLAVLIFSGVLAGVLAARSAATQPPARLTASTPRTASGATRSLLARVRAAVTPTLLDWRAIIPTTLTLAVFAVVVILIISLAGAVAPLASPSEGTVSEADAAHVLNSRIDMEYATVLRSEGAAASPEILLPQTIDGEPFLALGANYTGFSSVTNATLSRGKPPNATDEVVIGADLAETLGVGIGDSLTLGGSFSSAVTRVTVAGVFEAPGITDDQLIVPLTTAHHLSIRSGKVQYIRTDRTNFKGAASSPTNDSANGRISVTGVSAPSVVEANQPFPVTVRLENLEETNATRKIPVSINNVTQTQSITLTPGQNRQIALRIRATAPGNHTLRVGSYSQSIRVFPRNALRLPSELPSNAPPNATLGTLVITPDENPVPNATVAIGNATAMTDENGISQVNLPDEPGTYTITANKNDRPAGSHNISISRSAERRLSARLTVTPKTGNVLERPRANVTVANPWNTTLSRELVLTSPTTFRTRNVTLDPGETAGIGVDVFGGSTEGRASPGTYRLQLLSNGTVLARTEYTIEGDQRLSSALASNGQFSEGAGIGQAIRSVFGNIQLLFVTMVVLAGLTTIGTTAATFAQVIHARRHAIGVQRATGATPRRVLATVLVDVCLISIPASAIGIGLAVATAQILERFGTLTLFGLRLSTATPATVLVGTAVGAFLLTVIGAVLATIPFLTQSPTRLLTNSIAKLPRRGTDQQ